MVVDHPRRLHMGVTDRGADELETSGHKIFAEKDRLRGGRRKLREALPPVDQRPTVDETPDVFVEGAELLAHLQEGPGVRYCALDLAPVSDDRRVLEKKLDSLRIEEGDPLGVKTGEEPAEVFPLSKNRTPAEPRLHPFEDQEFEELEERHNFLDTQHADLIKSKPSTAKGQYLQKVSVSSTMGLGVIVDPSTLAATAAK